MNEEISAQFRTEGSPAFPTVEDTGNDNPASSPEGEQTTTEQTQSQEGDQAPAQEGQEGQPADGEGAGLADHPRWKEREDDWKGRFNEQETRHADELKRVTESMPAQVAAAVSEALKAAGVSKSSDGGVPEQIPNWFGGDEEAWQSFRQWNDQQLAAAEERGVEKTTKAISEKSEAEQRQIAEATDYLNSEVATIETDKAINPKGEKVDRNKLLKFVLDNDLVDSKGRWNYRAGFQMMQGQVASGAAPATQERKQMAADTTSENRAEPQPEPYTTSTDFSKPGARPW